MIIFGTKYFVWGSQLAAQASQCVQCGTVAPFILKKGMNFITFFFIIPTIPISKMSQIAECPHCHARYSA